MVEFVVRVPEITPHWMRVFLSGDGPALGYWLAHAIPLDRWDDGTHHARIDLPESHASRFLVTLGRWRDAESDGRGNELPAREVWSNSSTIFEAHVAGWGRGSIHYHHDFPSKFLPHPRSLSVYTPPGYDLNPHTHYPVLYMHDGQNLFDSSTAYGGHAWGCDEIAEQVIREGRVRPVIIVGIGNTADRVREYGPKKVGRDRSSDWSNDYARFLVEEVKSFIDGAYRTLPDRTHTGVCGSSLGGLISLALCKWYPGVFGLCGAMSPSLWWDGESFLRDLKVKPGWLNTCRIWLDMGGLEGYSKSTQKAGLTRTRKLAKGLGEYGLEKSGRLRYVEIPDGQHNEGAWGSRFGQVLEYLFGR